MTNVTAPAPLTRQFASLLTSTKADFVETNDAASTITQHGGVTIEPAGAFPGWPALATPPSGDPVIETFVLGQNGSVSAMSEHEPFVSVWLPLVAWLADSVVTACNYHDIGLSGDAYVTASCTPSADLEGLAHLDDDVFIPDDDVAAVAIFGQHVGPRVAIGQARAKPLRAMSQVQFAAETLDAFTTAELDHCQGAPNQIVLFPQFAQIHAGPASHHISAKHPNRQLLVLRARLSR